MNTTDQIRKSMCRVARGWYKPLIDNFDEVYLRCESPIERKFIGYLSGRLSPAVSVTAQENLIGGKYRADFVARAGGRAVVIECDGRQYHDFSRDRYRDLDILCHTEVNSVIRFRGCDVHFLKEDSVTALERFAPELFDRRPLEIEPGIILFGINPQKRDGCKPIVRAKFPRDAVIANLKHFEDSQTTTIYGTAPDGVSVVIEFKTPYWDWKVGAGNAYHIYSMAEGLIEMFEDLHEQANRDPMASLANRF